jgi:hypothetical protein
MTQITHWYIAFILTFQPLLVYIWIAISLLCIALFLYVYLLYLKHKK